MVFFAALAAPAQEEVLPPAPPTATAPATLPVPLSDVPARAVQALGVLRALGDGLQPAQEIVAIEKSLPLAVTQFATDFSQVNQVLAGVPSSDVLTELDAAWGARRKQVRAWGKALQARSRELEQALGTLDAMQSTWTKTREQAVEDKAPAVILSRIDEVLATNATVVERTRNRRGEILTKQETVGAMGANADGVLAEIDRTRTLFVSQLLDRQGPPIWRWFTSGTSEGVAEQVASSFRHQVAAVRDYLTSSGGDLLLPLLAALVVAFSLARGRERARKWVEDEPALSSVTQAFAVPFSTAALLFLVAIPLLNPLAPTALVQLVGLAALVPALRLLQRIVPGDLFAGLYGLSAFYVIDRVRSLLAAFSALEWTMFVFEMGAALLLTRWVFSSDRLTELGWSESDTRTRYLKLAGKVLTGVFSIAIVATVVGYVRLGGLLGDGALGSGYAAILLYASAEAVSGLWTYLLRSRLANQLRFVRNHRRVLQRRGRRVISIVALAVWVVVTLQYLALSTVLWDGLSAVLGARFSRGNLSVSLGDAVLFGGSVWGAVLLSRFVRFILEEDVYARVKLAHGASYALSTLLHYGLVVGGFLLGISVVGFDLSRFAIVAGALGVGIGFGLQNVVNNFVSGLILLFERPIQVGDAVEVGALTGQVHRIGIRSSTIRTWDGAEVIVPNGALIAETVTNWTLSDRMRRIEIPVGVAYGTDPQKVIEILADVFKQHREIVQSPAPVGLFVGFGDSSLDFLGRGWTAQFDRWVTTRSELMVATERALKEAGIEIPFPQRDLHLRSVDASAATELARDRD